MRGQVKQFAEQIYYPKETPDTLTPEIERLSKEAQTRDYNERIKDIKNLRLVKQQRIQETKEDRYTHALDTIIEWTEAGKKTMPYLYFNFYPEEEQEFVLFLNKLQKAGCFTGWSTNPFRDTHHIEFIFDGVNLNKLINYKKQLVYSSSKEWTKTELKKELLILKKLVKLTPGEVKLIDILSDLLPHSLSDLVNLKVSRTKNALEQLKAILCKKLSNTGWGIINEGRDYHSNSSYRLTHK